MSMDLASIHATSERCKSEGIPLSGKAITRLVRAGDLPGVRVGSKTLILWDNVLHLIRTGNRQVVPSEVVRGNIQPIQERRG